MQPSAFATDFTSASGSGSVQAAILRVPSGPLNRVGGSSGERRDAREFARDAERMARELGRLLGVLREIDRARERMRRLPHRPAAGDPRRARSSRPSQASASSLRPRAQRRRRRGAGDRSGRIRLGVGERQEHADHRHAVGIAVVDAKDHGAAALEALDEMELPERVVAVEVGARELRDQGLELAPGRPAPAVSRARRAGRGRNPRRAPSPRRRASARARQRNRGNARKRSSIVRRKRRKSTRESNTTTPTIIIRLVGRSMRSHAASTADMRSVSRIIGLQ